MPFSILPHTFVVLLTLSLFIKANAHADETLQKRLVGFWLETGFETKSRQTRESDNLIEFTADGGLRIYPKKGEKGDQHWLDGKWALSSDGVLKMDVVVDGQTSTTTGKISFEGEEMILEDEQTRRTRHRRHEGPLPERYQW